MLHVVLTVTLFGHLALWVALFNRLHAWPVPRRAIRPTEIFTVVVAAGGLGWAIYRTLTDHDWFATALTEGPYRVLWVAYVGICCLVGLRVIASWAWRRGWQVRTDCVLVNHTDRIDVAAELPESPMRGWSTKLFNCLPGNQMFDLFVHEKSVAFPDLPAELDGLSILHLSDLHFTGKITRPFFDYVIDRANDLDADLVAITGDILEHESCYPWLPATLGRLSHRHGAYFVLGNHDKRLDDIARLRRALVELNLVDLGQATHRLRVHGVDVLLAGNELPWFGPAPMVLAPQDRQFRILLSHSPDQITWARRRDFHLLLAGHTHGGHIRIPGIGPMVCPSRFGVKYACGMFWEPPTLMHVSRGISGLDPLRFFCPPELTKLDLRRAPRLQSEDRASLSRAPVHFSVPAELAGARYHL
ncbi:MAG: metallophosphoesterase [Pirellulaceae bacterium]